MYLKLCILLYPLSLIPITLDGFHTSTRVKLYKVASMFSLLTHLLYCTRWNIFEYWGLLTSYKIVQDLFEYSVSYFYLSSIVASKTLVPVLLSVGHLQIEDGDRVSVLTKVPFLSAMKLICLISTIGDFICDFGLYDAQHLLYTTKEDVVNYAFSIITYICGTPVNIFVWTVWFTFCITSSTLLELHIGAFRDLCENRVVDTSVHPIVVERPSELFIRSRFLEDSLLEATNHPGPSYLSRSCPNSQSCKAQRAKLLNKLYLIKHVYLQMENLYYYQVATQYIGSIVFILNTLSMADGSKKERNVFAMTSTAFEIIMMLSPILIHSLGRFVHYTFIVSSKRLVYKTTNSKLRYFVRHILETAREKYSNSYAVLFEYDLELCSNLVEALVLIATNVYVSTESYK